MKNVHFFLPAGLFLLICFMAFPFQMKAQNVKSQEVMNSLINAENKFSINRNNLGQKKAFQKAMVSNAILFRPDPQNGPEYIQKTEFKGSLVRTPVWAELSADGFFGLTTGPSTYLINDTTYYGEYVSVWLREPYDSAWKLFADASIRHPKKEGTVPTLSYSLKPISRYPAIYPKVISESKDILLSSDVIFATLLQTRNVEKAYNEFLGTESKLLIDGKLPILGRDSIVSYLKAKKGTFRSSATGAYVCYTRDLGFTYGTGEFVDAYRSNPSDFSFDYLRIWRKGKDGLWRVIIEMQMKKA